MYNRKQAIELAVKCANKYPESYVTGENFVPHEWVIEAIIEASKGSIHIIPKYHEPLIKNSFE